MHGGRGGHGVNVVVRWELYGHAHALCACSLKRVEKSVLRLCRASLLRVERGAVVFVRKTMRDHQTLDDVIVE